MLPHGEARARGEPASARRQPETVQPAAPLLLGAVGVPISTVRYLGGAAAAAVACSAAPFSLAAPGRAAVWKNRKSCADSAGLLLRSP